MSYGNTTLTVSITSSKFAISFLLAVAVSTPRTIPSLSVTWCFLNPKWYFPLFFNQVPSLSILSAYSLCTSTWSSQRSSVTLKFVFSFGLSGVSIKLALIIKPIFTMILFVSSCLFLEANNFSKVLFWLMRF
jgi:hypothetical protein